jgi:hypothetical protein
MLLGVVQLLVVEQENPVVFQPYAEMVEVMLLLGFEES